MLMRIRRSFVRALSTMALAALAGTVGLAGAEVEPGMAMGIDYPNGDISRIALSNPDPGLCRRACDEKIGRASCRERV